LLHEAGKILQRVAGDLLGAHLLSVTTCWPRTSVSLG
jgi:hypothetical protein